MQTIVLPLLQEGSTHVVPKTGGNISDGATATSKFFSLASSGTHQDLSYDDVIRPYIKSTEIFVCPSRKGITSDPTSPGPTLQIASATLMYYLGCVHKAGGSVDNNYAVVYDFAADGDQNPISSFTSVAETFIVGEGADPNLNAQHGASMTAPADGALNIPQPAQAHFRWR